MSAAALEGLRAFVAGGAGHVGEGVVRALLGHGATVVVSSRSRVKLDPLAQTLIHPSRFTSIEAD